MSLIELLGFSHFKFEVRSVDFILIILLFFVDFEGVELIQEAILILFFFTL